jgi:penicillin amidase
VEIEDWTPADSLAVMKLYSWALSDALEASLVLSDVIQQLGGFAARRFFPDGGGDGFPSPGSFPVTAQGPGAGPRTGPGSALRRAVGLAGASVGSSAWVIGGAHTRSGRPMLVADAHLEPTVPALLHLAHVSGGDLDVAGAALPGVPVFWTGHNRHVAWASTHARATTTDLYRETLRASDPSHYHDGRRWQAVDTRVEQIRVRGGDDVILSVRSTRHGPLLEPILGGQREPLSLAWAGARAGESGVASMLALARAGDADALLAALTRHVEPPLALVYADDGGAAGLQVAGWIPRRAVATALLPLPGRAPHYEWKGRIPFEALPSARLEGGRGWAIAADNRFASSHEDEHIEWLWRSGERARRIDQLLRAATRRGPVDLRRMTRVQSDVRMVRARELVSDALSLAGDEEALPAEAREVIHLLKDWAGDARADSPAAAAYHVFLQALTEQLLGQHLGSELLERYLGLPQVDPAALVTDLVRDAAGGRESGTWSDADQVRTAVRRSLREAWFRLAYRLGPDREKWSWGRLHPLRFRPFVPGPGAGALGPFDFGGSTSTVAVAEYDPAVPFGVRVAATYRFAIDTGDLDEALVSLAPGQSEHPGHANYRSGLDDWLVGKPGLLASSPLQVEESAVARLVLTPAP